MPWATPSTRRRNSEDRGSGASLAMICRHSCTGKPDLTPRTMMSAASGKPATNLLARRLARKPTVHCGSPSPAPSPKPNPISGFWPRNTSTPKISRPRTPDAIQKARIGMFRPACCSRPARETLALRWRRSWSRRLFRICLRRAVGSGAAVRAREWVRLRSAMA